MLKVEIHTKQSHNFIHEAEENDHITPNIKSVY